MMYELACGLARTLFIRPLEKAFQCSKELLTSSLLLVHFDPTLPVILACDDSKVDIGAVLAHRMPYGGERPIGYVLRSLTKAERNHSQLEKEGLSCEYNLSSDGCHMK